MLKTENASLMAHMIPFFPNEQVSRDVVEALVDSGIKYLELQFPFSDPTADGPAISAACQIALKEGFTVDKGFAFLRSVSDFCKNSGVEVFVMTYASLVYTRGVSKFLKDAKAAGADGLIVPDLPVDLDEGLYQESKALGLEAVPVIVPNISAQRLALVEGLKTKYIYSALRSGITGSSTQLEPGLLKWLDELKEKGCKIFGGFGIDSSEKVFALKDHVEGVVVGSALVRKIEELHASKVSVYDPLKNFVESLKEA